jgi:hypothetical protein
VIGKATAFGGTPPKMFYTHLFPPSRSACLPSFSPIDGNTSLIFHRGYFPPFCDSPQNLSKEANLFHYFIVSQHYPLQPRYHTLWREEIYGGDKEFI